MALIVQKYGGTSVGSTDRIKNVARRVAHYQRAGPSGRRRRVGDVRRDQPPARAGAKELSANPDPRELDVDRRHRRAGHDRPPGHRAAGDAASGARSYTGGQVRILTDSAFTKARILAIDEASMRRDLERGQRGHRRRLPGRGRRRQHHDARPRRLRHVRRRAGGGAASADECQIYTDVDGVYTTDPRIVPEARRLATVTFEEMLEMASLGSKVLQIRSVEFAGKYKVKLRVLSSFDDPESTATGTLITFEEDEDHGTGDHFRHRVQPRRSQDLGDGRAPTSPASRTRSWDPIAAANLDVDMIVQNIGASGHTDFSFTVNRNEYAQTLDVLEQERGKGFTAREIIGDNRICKVSVIGIGMRSHVGIASRMFKALAEEGINIQMISTSEIKISVVIDEKYLELAVRVLHKAFELEKEPA